MISVRLNQNLEQELTQYSKRNQVTKTDVIREALVHYFNTANKEKKATAYELGADIFGKYGSGQEDLSTTYKQKLKDKIDAKNTYR
jgi:predicted DNA-binding protein